MVCVKARLYKKQSFYSNDTPTRSCSSTTLFQEETMPFLKLNWKRSKCSLIVSDGGASSKLKHCWRMDFSMSKRPFFLWIGMTQFVQSFVEDDAFSTWYGPYKTSSITSLGICHRIQFSNW